MSATGETASELVARGAALLDSRLPGWADQIDLESLNIADGCECVLGQLGSRRVNLDRLSWEPRPWQNGFAELADAFGIATWEFGFSARNHVTNLDLLDAWNDEIVARRTLDAL